MRLLLLALLLLGTALGHGEHVWRRLRGQAPPAGEGGRRGHASVYVWFGCYVTLLLLAAGRLLLGAGVGLAAWPGVGLLLLGAALRRWALRELGRFFDEFIYVHSDHRVVDTGPYRYCRHPLYKGLLLELLGLTLVSGAALAWSLFLVSLFFFFQRGREEERVLMERLGEAYADYRRRVPSLVDLVVRRRPSC